eukprot:662344-Prorocentrum_minimum.AAC.1
MGGPIDREDRALTWLLANHVVAQGGAPLAARGDAPFACGSAHRRRRSHRARVHAAASRGLPWLLRRRAAGVTLPSHPATLPSHRTR